jgi:hypothetical protein
MPDTNASILIAESALNKCIATKIHAYATPRKCKKAKAEHIPVNKNNPPCVITFLQNCFDKIP